MTGRGTTNSALSAQDVLDLGSGTFDPQPRPRTTPSAAGDAVRIDGDHGDKLSLSGNWTALDPSNGARRLRRVRLPCADGQRQRLRARARGHRGHDRGYRLSRRRSSAAAGARAAFAARAPADDDETVSAPLTRAAAAAGSAAAPAAPGSSWRGRPPPGSASARSSAACGRCPAAAGHAGDRGGRRG